MREFLEFFRRTLLIEAALAVVFDLLTRRSPPVRVGAFRRELARCPEAERKRLLQEAAREALTLGRRATFWGAFVVITSAAGAAGHLLATRVDRPWESIIMGTAFAAGFWIATQVGDRLLRRWIGPVLVIRLRRSGLPLLPDPSSSAPSAPPPAPVSTSP